jgi:hypothetical protein
MSLDESKGSRPVAEDRGPANVQESVDSKRQYTIKGIETETLDLMRTAARKQGMKVGAWVSARLREAADKALSVQQSRKDDGLAELREHIQRIEENQIQERESLRSIQQELNGMLRAQNSIMSKILNTV